MPPEDGTLHMVETSVASETVLGIAQPNPRLQRDFWRVAALVGFALIFGILVYIFWPLQTNQAIANERQQASTMKEEATRVEALVITPLDYPVRIEATGHLVPARRAEISAEATGLVSNFPVVEGSYVPAGGLLLQLDDRDQLIDEREANDELLKAQAAYAVNSKGSDEIALTDTTHLALARITWRESNDTFARGLLSEDELRMARRRFEAAQMLSGQQREAVQAIISGLAAAEQRYERARLALSRTKITAPFAGRIADIEVEVGQRVATGQQVLSLMDDSQMKVEVDVLEAELVKLTPGAATRVRIPSLDDAIFEGEIYTINPNIDLQSGTGRVTVLISNPQGQLMAGLFAHVELETNRLRSRLIVPTNAVLTRQGRDLLFRVKDALAQWTYVTLGERSGDYVEIIDGLSPGDTVLVAGHFVLAHEAPVQISKVHKSILP